MLNSTFCRFLLICSLFITLSSARAQYIPITDTVFAYYISNYLAYGCMSGNATTGYLMDTNCVSQYTDTMLTLLGMGIPNMPQGFTNINGVQYFRNLHQLTVSENSYMQTFPPLTNMTHLKWLDCSQNALNTISLLPDSLEKLICSTNNLSSLPSLPSSLTDLEVGYNPLGHLPSPLPPNLLIFECEGNLLSNMPVLPDSLTNLICGYNSLTGLPSLPPNLVQLNCPQNLLTSLPALPGSVTYTDCSHNQLTSLPPIPCGLNSELHCDENYNLSCLPGGITCLFNFSFDSTQISCLPNPMTCVISSPLSTDSMPLCSSMSGCSFAYNITGNVHLFTAEDCATDSVNPGVAINGIKLNLSKGGQLLRQTYSVGPRDGQYTFATDSEAVYTVSVDTGSLPFSVICPGNLVRTDSVSSIDSIFIHQDFALQCNGVDNGVSYIYTHLRLGIPVAMYINAGDMGAFYGSPCPNNSSGTVTTYLSGPASYVGSAQGALTPSSVSGNILTYNIADFGSLQYGDLNIMVMTDSSATFDSSVCIVVSLQTNGGEDINPANDALAECFPVFSSFDPNVKAAYPSNTVDTGSHWITYTVNFQNTGNDTAYNVFVRDTMSSFVDPLSFQLLAASARVLTNITGNAVAFTFPKINLVDSGHNEPLSHGWLEYKVKTRPSLPLGTLVKNTAYIYFDVNPAVVTNTTVNVVDTFESKLGVKTINGINTIHLYPNPNKGSFTLQTSNSIGATYSITDMLGNTITQQTIHSDNQPIDLPEAAEGVYTLVVKGTQPLRFVIVR